MIFLYTVTITGENDTISFKNENGNNDPITGVKFRFNSDDSERDRDRNARVEIVINGKFNGESAILTEIKKMSDWAISKSNIYREITIEIYSTENNSSEGNYKRTYHFDKMFCMDYSEKCGCDSNGISFELFVAQAPTHKIGETMAETIS